MTRMMTINQVSKETGLAANYLRNACKNGEIPHIKSGNRVYINFEMFEESLKKEGLTYEQRVG